MIEISYLHERRVIILNWQYVLAKRCLSDVRFITAQLQLWRVNGNDREDEREIVEAGSQISLIRYALCRGCSIYLSLTKSV